LFVSLYKELLNCFMSLYFVLWVCILWICIKNSWIVLWVCILWVCIKNSWIVLWVCSFVRMYLILSFQLKCSSNIDSIHYLGLTNSYEFKFIFTSCAFPIGQSVLKRNLIGSFKSNRKLINFPLNELVSPR
jgi:hypothetical protein